MVDGPWSRGRPCDVAGSAPHLAGAARAVPAGGRHGSIDGGGLHPDRADGPAVPARLAVRDHAAWSLSTGSRVAVYHYPPANSGTRHPVPFVYLNGGPVRGISVLDHRFLQLLARQGYDVYAYEQAGGGRSDLLPMDQYTISRSVRDLAAFVDRLDKGKVDVLGFSSGGVVLTRALADPERRRTLAPGDHRRARTHGRPHRAYRRAQGPKVRARPRTGHDRTAIDARPPVRLGIRPHAARTPHPRHRTDRTGRGRQRLHRRRPRQRHRLRLLRARRAPHPRRGHRTELLLQPRRQPPHPADGQGLTLHRPATEAVPDPRDADDRRVLLAGPSMGDRHPCQ